MLFLQGGVVLFKLGIVCFLFGIVPSNIFVKFFKLILLLKSNCDGVVFLILKYFNCWNYLFNLAFLCLMNLFYVTCNLIFGLFSFNFVFF